MTVQAETQTAPRGRLMAEFAIFFVVAPVAIAVLLPATIMFPALFLITAIGLVLLHVSDGFHWGDLGRGWQAVFWKKIAFFCGPHLCCLSCGDLCAGP